MRFSHPAANGPIDTPGRGHGMIQTDGCGRFNASAALLWTDGLLHELETTALRNAASAWDAAWIACLTNSPTWSAMASGHSRI